MTASPTPWTKGPWKTTGATLVWSPAAKANIAQASELRATTMVRFTEPGIGSDDFHEIAANARLIASAPELYEALAALVETHDDSVEPSTVKWAAARQALRTARGETP